MFVDVWQNLFAKLVYVLYILIQKVCEKNIFLTQVLGMDREPTMYSFCPDVTRRQCVTSLINGQVIL